MDKELKDLLKELKGLAEVLGSGDKLDKIKKLETAIEKAHKQTASISVEKHEDGRADIKVEGTRLALLITLAGLEKGVLEQLDCSVGEFEFIKNTVGTREDK